MNCVLESSTAFKSKYSKNPIISKAIKCCILGIGASSAIIGSAAASAGSAASTVAATTGLAGFVGHFASWPVIGSAAGGYVSAAASGAATAAAGTAAIAALPVSLAVGGAISTTALILIRKKTAPYQKGAGLENLAQTVGKIIFLPLLSKYKEVIEKDSSKKIEEAIDAAVSRITEWGYKREYANNLVNKAFESSSNELSEKFDLILKKLNKLKKNECFDGFPKYELPPIPKFQLPPKGIQKLAKQLVKESINR